MGAAGQATTGAAGFRLESKPGTCYARNRYARRPNNRLVRARASSGKRLGQDVQRACELGVGNGQGIQEAQDVSVYTAA